MTWWPRLLAQTQLGGPDGDCLIWIGALNNGYGQIKIRNMAYRVHRLTYAHVYGELPDDLWIDHDAHCAERACVNPSHLEAVTPQVSTFRSRSVSAFNAGKRFCPRGHPYNEDNTLVSKGFRYCRTCRWEKRHPLAKYADQLTEAMQA